MLGESCEPSGLMMKTLLLAMVTPVSLRLTRWPAVPLKVARAPCPATPAVTVTAGPPGAME
jgi:hypothetical protein